MKAVAKGEAQEMTAPKTETEWLTKEQIDAVIESMSASDLIDAMGDGVKTQSSAKMAGIAFDAAAARMGLSNGTPATQHVRMVDFPYMAGKIGASVNIENPTSEEQSD